MTDYDDPTPPELVSRLLELLDVKDHGGDRFEGRRKIGGVGRVFGGQVIGQALASAERTVPDDRPVHSLHAYFLRGGSEDHEIDFKVERDLDGGSFSNRRIVASQLGKPILNMAASFHKREEGFEHAAEMPDVVGPEGLATERELRLK
ncbi:MAG: acyl-CoA thioesterase II, partial [Novosphingobium sp. 16-62-11]